MSTPKPADDPKTDPKEPAPTPAPAPQPEPKPADEKPTNEPPKAAGKTFTKAEQEAAIAKAIEDAKKKWDAEKDLSELERIKKENAELLTSIRMRDAKEEIVAALTAAGSKSPALAFEAIKGSLQFDDAGKLVNGKDLIEGLKTNYPEVFGEEKTAAGDIDAGKGTKNSGGSTLTAEKLAAMSPDEINKLPWEEVAKVMSGK